MKPSLLKAAKSPVMQAIKAAAWLLLSQEALRYAKATLRVIKRRLSGEKSTN